MRRPRIGVVNWDAIYPGDTYFGGYAHRSLANGAHKNRLPYFAKEDENGGFYFQERTGEEYDRELTFAIDAGIDFFMYCWYPEKNQDPEIGEETIHYLHSHVFELNQNAIWCIR